MSLMPDIKFLLSDPDLGAQAFTITRQKGNWQNGRLIVSPTDGKQTIQAIGIIVPPDQDQLDRFPEGERRKEKKVIYSNTLMYLSEGNNVSDEITWHENRYKIVGVEPWDDWGFCVAYAVRG